jgi:3',5'-nucleoside bisphosphate phosphatase
MIDAGHVADTREAFDKWLGPDCPAFVPRSGPTPEHVVEAIHRAGGLASLAHPGRTKIDARIPALARAGLDALEVYHSDHDAAAIEAYRAMAIGLSLLITGGSDFHGDPAHGLKPGSAGLPEDDWQRLRAARHRHAVA